MRIRTLVWNEFDHERRDPAIAAIYPEGIHGCIAEVLNRDEQIHADTATQPEPEHGLPQSRLDETDVLVWWGHIRQDDVAEDVVERVVRRVWEGMGLIVLHSAHFSKPFRRLMGTPCTLTWRDAGEREHVWVTAPGHPIVQGLPDHFTLAKEEMYGEPFAVPEPDETVMISWFKGGEVLRSGMTWSRGGGRVFYFQPGHETLPTYRNENVGHVLQNAVRWAANPGSRTIVRDLPDNRPSARALEPLGQTRSR